MADHVERAGAYALVCLAVVQHWNTVCPDEWHVRQIIPNPKATWAFARAFLRAPAKKRKRSLEGLKKNKKIAVSKGKQPRSHVHLESGRLGLKLKLGEGGCGVATGGTGGSGFSSAARAEA